MTGAEFKAWLEGALEFHKGPPTKVLVERIKAKADEIVDVAPCSHWHWYNIPSVSPFMQPYLPYTSPTIPSWGTTEVTTTDFVVNN